MSRLEAAMERFSAALDTLESRIQARLAESAETGHASLSAERDRLAAEVSRLSEECAALEGLTGQVATRLDSAIREIRVVLEH